MTLTQQQFNTALQNVQSRYIYLELLNYQFQTVNELSGIATSGSISIDANADIRRTGSITMVVQNGTFTPQSGGQIWLDKYIRVWVGIASLQTGEIERVNCGLFIIDAPSYTYDPSTNVLSLSLLDLMAKLTGVRNGYLPGIPTILSAGENIRSAMIDTLALGGFTKYVIEEAPSPSVIPNDLEFGQGATIYDLLSGLANIYPDFEIFFSTDGTFYYKPIPTGEGDPVIADDTLWSKIVTQEKLDVDFQSVKNSIEVYGRTHDPAYFASAVSVSGVNITLTIGSVAAYTTDAIYGFTMTNPVQLVAPSLKVGSLSNLPIQNDDGTATTIQAEIGDITFCVQYKGTYWRWLGHLQAYGFAEDVNPDSPFYVDGTVGRIRQVLYDGDYANCMTDELSQIRADYELWLRTNMNNTITLTCAPCYWLDVNNLISYTSWNTRATNQYLIKSINFGLAPEDSMSLTAIRFYSDYPNITGN